VQIPEDMRRALAANARIAASAVKAALGMPYVSLLYKAYAAYPKFLDLHWQAFKPVVETQEFFDRADREGVLVMAGWCCCDHWEHWAKWKPQDFDIAKASLQDQIYRLRSHPSVVMWLNGSDNAPPPDVEQMYLDVEKDLFWPNPVVSSATGKKTSVTGDSGKYTYTVSVLLTSDALGGRFSASSQARAIRSRAGLASDSSRAANRSA